MAEKESFQMTLPASEIDAALLAAKNAVSYEPQTIPPEKQAQARANLGIFGNGLPVYTMKTSFDEPTGTMDEEDAAILLNACRNGTPFVGAFEAIATHAVVNVMSFPDYYIGWFIMAMGEDLATVSLLTLDSGGGLYTIKLIPAVDIE